MFRMYDSNSELRNSGNLFLYTGRYLGFCFLFLPFEDSGCYSVFIGSWRFALEVITAMEIFPPGNLIFGKLSSTSLANRPSLVRVPSPSG